jgi:DNA mismatch endonuclease, patch repair protein
MADTISPEQRSDVMARVKGKDTRPEMLLRKALYAIGVRGVALPSGQTRREA